MKTTLLKIATADKLTLQGILYEPDVKTNNVILHIHGMAGNFYENQFIDVMATDFTNDGIAFLSINTRGHDFIADFKVDGQDEEYKRIGSHIEKFEDCLIDIDAWFNWAANRFENIILQGHSLGAVKVVYYFYKKQTQNNKKISKLILLSPPDMVGLAEDEKDFEEVVSTAKQMISAGKQDEMLPKLIWEGYPLTAGTYVNFSERDLPIDIFNTYDKEKESIALGSINIPVLAVMGEHDDAATFLKSEEVLSVIKSKSVNCNSFKTKIIKGASHSYFNCEKDLTRTILDWLK